MKVDNCLSNVEQGGPKEEANAAIAKAKIEREFTTKKVKAETKHAMKAAGCAFLKEKNKMSTSSGIPKLMEEAMNKLFIIDFNKEALPKALMPPPYPQLLIVANSFSIHILSFPRFDDKEDPMS